MKIHRDGLDEMQKEKRGKIGNQMFVMMFFALLLDSALFKAGIRWLEHPSGTLAVIMACMAIYLIRLIAANAHLSPKAQSRAVLKFLILAAVFSAMLALTGYFLFKTAPINVTALIFFIVSAIGLFISLFVAAAQKSRDKKAGDN